MSDHMTACYLHSHPSVRSVAYAVGPGVAPRGVACIHATSSSDPRAQNTEPGCADGGGKERQLPATTQGDAEGRVC